MNASSRFRPSHSSHKQRPLGISFFLSLLLIATAFTFGGASRQHAELVAIIEVVSIPLLLWGANRLFQTGAWSEIKIPLALLAAAVALPLLQLIPLPFDVWSSLPGREGAAAAAILAGLENLAQPLSLNPKGTLHSVLALLPPAAMFLAAVRLSTRERQLLIGFALVAVMANLVIGVAQVAGGGSLYFYENTNRGLAVGLFSNRNHYAILLVSALPMAALWITSLKTRRERIRLALILGAITVLALVLIGIVMSRSRAAVGLLIPSFLIAAAMVWKGAPRAIPRRLIYTLIAVVGLALLAATIFGGRMLTQTLEKDLLTDIRFAAAPTILREAFSQFPFGTGIGSFELAFQSFEPPRLIAREFLNHAHNDYLELLLEGGAPALGLILLFLAWWGRAVVKALRAQGPYGDLARLGATVTGLLLVHSLVDYPLRTPALATFFAFGLALLATPEPLGQRRPQSGKRPDREA